MAASADEAGDEIHACVAKNGGDVRIIKGKDCKDKERFIEWNEEGPRGATGPQGPPGPTLTSGRATATANTYALTGAYTNVPGLAVTLPAAGTYALSADVRGYINSDPGTAHCYIVAQLADTVAGAVTDSERLVIIEIGTIGAAGKNAQNTVPIQEILTVPGARTITVQAFRAGCGGVTTVSAIASNAQGRSTLNFVKIA